MRVLIAEDDADARYLLEELLTRWGYDVVVAGDGQEAWEILNGEDSPRLAILDWMMPGMDGIDICRRLRCKADTYVYVILLTARSRKADVVEGIEAGADDYIIKPFEPHELRARVRAGTRILELQAELLAMRESFRNQATHDSLTGLPNRLMFSDRLSHKLAEARRSGRHLAVMFLDVDRFKRINDTMGHNMGDILLKGISERLTASFREVDVVARMGGDEFTVILSDISRMQDAARIARRALAALSKPFVLNGQEVFITCSMGISMYPADGEDVETLVRNADTAMYWAKEQGKDQFQFYSGVLNDLASNRMKLENDLHKAIANGELRVHYQPRVDLKSGRILGAEALVRWQHPDIGLIPPMDFIPLAEDIGLIIPITEWVLRQACSQNKAWQDAGYPPMEVAVNISPRHFQLGNLTRMVRQVLRETDLPPQYLALELTESALMQNAEQAATALRSLKRLGVRISIDDFGTGQSSLSYLKHLPTDVLKMDQSFLRGINIDPEAAAIAGAVVAMAHSLKLKVIAEGVETLDQLEFLRSINCDEMQGYFVSRPVPSEEFAHILEEAKESHTEEGLRAA